MYRKVHTTWAGRQIGSVSCRLGDAWTQPDRRVQFQSSGSGDIGFGVSPPVFGYLSASRSLAGDKDCAFRRGCGSTGCDFVRIQKVNNPNIPFLWGTSAGPGGSRCSRPANRVFKKKKPATKPANTNDRIGPRQR
ncbi:hypothetical protein ZHAS_00021598 [Anopheles sinensis]|uniref:Uncharacterized protein n=1 Tax=Anopheles sinensis TaxID=74873 RepID=A0A084WSU9_ANOSI|nr:hypothetical protein ZHAS_00021598 [Anopheles sinensis]